MSYNIDRFKLKKIRLTLPLDVKLNEYSPYIDNATVDLSNATFSVNEDGEGFQMSGKVTKAGLEVESVNCWGEGSGHDYNDILIPLFRDYKGDLEAVCIWESGDSITKLTINNGVWTEKEVEL